MAYPTSRAFASILTNRIAQRTAVAGLGTALALGLATPAFADSGNNTAPKPAAAQIAAPAAPHTGTAGAKSPVTVKVPAVKASSVKAPVAAAAKAAAAAKSATITAAELMPNGKPGHQSEIRLSASQKANAVAIVKAAKEMKLPPRAAVIAVATALQESKLHNYGNLGSHNDHDSVGLFQQRPSSGWGSPSDCQSPDHAAKSFLSRLVHVHNWNKMALTHAAQAVQVSAFGDRYAQWEAQAASLVSGSFNVN